MKKVFIIPQSKDNLTLKMLGSYLLFFSSYVKMLGNIMFTHTFYLAFIFPLSIIPYTYLK